MNFSIISNSIIFHQSAMILTIFDLEHDRIAGYNCTATFTRMFTPKPSAMCAEFGDRQSLQTIWLRYMKFDIEF